MLGVDVARRVFVPKSFVLARLESNVTSQRSALREGFLTESRATVAEKFKGVGASGTPFWPMSRRIRRSIEFAAMKNNWRKRTV